MTDATLTTAALYYERRNEKAKNRETLLDLLSDALSAADVVVGPETATTNTELNRESIVDHAEPVHGETVSSAQELVDRKGGIAVFGLVERDGDDVYNSCVVLAPNEEPGVYRQPLYVEPFSWTSGFGDHRVFETDITTVAPAICGELEIEPGPELETKTKQTFLQEAEFDLVTAPASWGEYDGDEPLLDRWRELSDQLDCPVVIGNVYQPAHRNQDDYVFDGPAGIVDRGRILAVTRSPPSFVTADLSLSATYR